MDELERILAARPQRFRLQFFGVGADLGPAVLTETEIQATDASGAIREAVASELAARERSACACSISRGARSSSGSRPICDSAAFRRETLTVSRRPDPLKTIA